MGCHPSNNTEKQKGTERVTVYISVDDTNSQVTWSQPTNKQPPATSNRRPRAHSIPWFFMISLTLMFFAFNLRASSASKLLTGAAWPFSPAAAEAEAEAGAAAAAEAAEAAAPEISASEMPVEAE